MSERENKSAHEVMKMPSSAFELQDDEAAALAEHLERELRYYERDKIACQLKSCATFQFFAAIWYAFAAPLPNGHGFGILCASTSVLVFCAAHKGRTLLLQLSLGATSLVLLTALLFAWRLSGAMQEVDHDQASSRRLLLCFATLSVVVALLQVPTLRFSRMLLTPPARRHGASDDSLLLPSDELQDLLHVDLSHTPPDPEQGRPRSPASATARLYLYG